MRLLGIVLSAVLLGGCVLVPAAPVAYVPGPSVRVDYVAPAYPYYGYRYSYGYRYYHR